MFVPMVMVLVRACHGRRDHERGGQVAVVHEVVLREPGPREAEPLTLLDLLQALAVEGRVVS